MNRYAVCYIIRRNKCDTPRAKVFKASNSKEARSKFDEWYYSREVSSLPHPFHIAVKRFDKLINCPFCGTLMLRQGDALQCANAWHCGIKIAPNK